MASHSGSKAGKCSQLTGCFKSSSEDDTIAMVMLLNGNKNNWIEFDHNLKIVAKKLFGDLAKWCLVKKVAVPEFDLKKVIKSIQRKLEESMLQESGDEQESEEETTEQVIEPQD